jgi:hypothetical protein
MAWPKGVVSATLLKKKKKKNMKEEEEIVYGSLRLGDGIS